MSFYDTIVQVLSEKLKPSHLEVIDESHMHSRRTKESPETHFKVIVVSDQFKGLSKVKRQQLVYSHLQPLFDQGLHALSQSTFTSEEWAKKPQVEASPVCASSKDRRVVS